MQFQWNAAEKRIFAKLKSPRDIQDFLDGTQYSGEPVYRSPRQVIADQKAHCADGALFAAAALWQLGEEPLIMELRAERDDDHLLAVYRRNGLYGAVAKSNFTGLRFREAIHRSLRELALSYFVPYFNLDKEPSLRGYSCLMNLKDFVQVGWLYRDDGIEGIMDRLDKVRHFPLYPKALVEGFSLVDERAFQAGVIGINWDGAYKPH